MRRNKQYGARLSLGWETRQDAAEKLFKTANWDQSFYQSSVIMWHSASPAELHGATKSTRGLPPYFINPLHHQISIYHIVPNEFS
jgi:hypothetical protein